MTRDEVKKIVLITKRSFPNWNLGDENELTETIDVWAAIFRDDDYEAIEAGLMNYIRNDKSGFAPAPGQIRSSIREMAEPYDDTEDMIAILRKAIGRSGYYYEEEFLKLPDLLKKAVGQATNLRAWSQLTSKDELESVAFSHVRRAYRNIKSQETKLRTLDPIRNETLKEVQRKLEDTHRPADRLMIETKKPEPRISGERTAYKMQLTDEERSALRTCWNRKEGRMILTDLMISPARDRKLRGYIDQYGIDEITRREDESQALTFGQFLEELERLEVLV